MNVVLSFQKTNTLKELIKLPGSKSESNRLLVIQKIFKDLQITNLSNSDDTNSIIEGLSSSSGTIDIHHAGTAMRFLTAFYASQEGQEIILTGSQRMQERPIEVLVNALKSIGSKIDYVAQEGYPPLRITGVKLTANEVDLNASVSSQYITALMLIAPTIENGLTINLQGKITSIPYIEMTLDLLKRVGVFGNFTENKISIPFKKSIEPIIITVESDWSAVSYYYSMVALSESMELNLAYFHENSLQGDAQLVKMYESLGVQTIFNKEQQQLSIKKVPCNITNLDLDLNNTPDIAQTIAVTCFGLGISCKLTGLHTLKIKETDRLVALKNELEKLGANCTISDDSLRLEPSANIKEGISIETYQDHRMAMAFAPLSLKTSLEIQEAEVVTKSYPDFWEDIQKLGIQIQEK